MTSSTTSEIPAFPLGTVLLPGQLLTLQVFEPRYRVMLFDLRDDDPIEFLVTLIMRGSEVGGGDVRARVGCLARVRQSVDQPDGRVVLDVVGQRPLEILQWLPEDPYPVARVAPETAQIRDVAEMPTEPTGQLRRAVDLDHELSELLRRLGVLVEPRPTEPQQIEEFVWQAALRNPIGSLDRQRLLEAPELDTRIGLLAETLADQIEILRARLPPDSEVPPST